MTAVLDRLSARAARYWPPGGGEIAIAHRFQRPPYGGSNQFLLALRGELRRSGYRVVPNRITRRTSACLLNAFLFDERVLAHADRERVRVVHRVDGPVGVYRGFDDGTDRRIVELNERFAHATVLQSRYSLDATRALGIELRAPTVIHNAVDPEIFHPAAGRRAVEERPLRLIATSWSDNPNKGADTLAWLDEHLDWSRYECTFVGRIGIPLRNIRIVPPLASRELAGALRAHDVYLAPSRNDPCSNALLEGLACGLPAVFLESGGHPELVGDGGLGYREPADIPALLERLQREYADRRAAISLPTLGDVARAYLEVLGLD